jgi:hypothetical protein
MPDIPQARTPVRWQAHRVITVNLVVVFRVILEEAVDSRMTIMVTMMVITKAVVVVESITTTTTTTSVVMITTRMCTHRLLATSKQQVECMLIPTDKRGACTMATRLNLLITPMQPTGSTPVCSTPKQGNAILNREAILVVWALREANRANRVSLNRAVKVRMLPAIRGLGVHPRAAESTRISSVLWTVGCQS